MQTSDFKNHPMNKDHENQAIIVKSGIYDILIG